MLIDVCFAPICVILPPAADTELDKSVIDQLNDPLMHLIRNSMDHGIEPPEGC
jgi:two-component system chemotaxis sensor kinase CheA